MTRRSRSDDFRRFVNDPKIPTIGKRQHGRHSLDRPEFPDRPKFAVELYEKGPPPYHVRVAIPSGRAQLPTQTATDLASLIGFSTITLVADHVASIALDTVMGTMVHPARCELVGMALRHNATHILFIDDDMRFPENGLLRLMNWNVPIVGTNYSARKTPPRPIAYEKIGALSRGEGKLRWTEPDAKGLVEVEGIGLGFTLIQMQVFEKLGRETFPWFDYRYDKAARQWVGEDIHFCQLARAAGFKIYIDEGLSNELEHIGRFNYTLDAAYQFKEEYENESRHLREPEDIDRFLAQQDGSDDVDT